LALRLLFELQREFDRPLDVAFLDIKAAFDSVDRIALWMTLRSPTLFDLIAALHKSTGARFWVGQQLSGRIRTTFGVRQGCILAPALFCVAINWITEHMSAHPGIEVDLNSFADLMYTDDTALFLPHDQDFTEMLSSFRCAAAPLCLHVSWAKTKLDNLGSILRPASVSVNGNLVETVDTFVYLGNIQSFDGYCWPDMKRRIGLPASAMSLLHSNCSDKRFSIPAKNPSLPGFGTLNILYAFDFPRPGLSTSLI